MPPVLSVSHLASGLSPVDGQSHHPTIASHIILSGLSFCCDFSCDTVLLSAPLVHDGNPHADRLPHSTHNLSVFERVNAHLSG